MAHKITVRMGGHAEATTKDYTAQVPTFVPGEDGGQWTASMRFDQGGASQFSFTVDDDDNDIYTAGTDQIEPHNLVTITEDASGTEYALAIGRRGRWDGERGDLYMGSARRHLIVCDDANIDLDGMDLTEAWERPEETGTERLLALGAAFLDGDPRLTTEIVTERWAASGEGHLVKPNPDDGEATMPAHTYEMGTPLGDIIADCAETEGQAWGIVLHDDESGSHLCFEYTEEDDWETYPCSIAISDDPDDIDNDTVFAPIWDSGAAVEGDGQQVLTGIVSEYGDERAHVFYEDTSLIERYDRWVKKWVDATTTTLAGATARAPHALRGFSQEHLSHNVTIKVPADKAHLVRAGMSIDIKSAASRHQETLGTFATRRVAEVKAEPCAPEVGEVLGSYYLHLQLDRPRKIARARRRPGPRAPTPDVPFDGNASLGAACTLDPDPYDPVELGDEKVERVQMTTDRQATAGQSIVVITTRRGSTSGNHAVYDSAGNTYTKVAEHNNSTHSQVCIWVANVTSTLPGGGTIGYEAGTALLTTLELGGKCISAYLFDGTLSDGTESGTGGSFGTSPSVAVGAGDLIVAALGLKGGATGFPDTITNDGDWTSFTQAFTAANSDDSQAVAGGFRIGDTDGETWSGTIDQNRDWAMVGAIFTTSDELNDGPADELGTTGGPYANVDHNHQHDNLLGNPGSDFHVPAGGSDGQVLTKQSGTDYDATWETPSGGSGGLSVPLVINAPSTFAGSADKDFRGAANLTPYTASGPSSGTVDIHETGTSVNRYELTANGLYTQVGNSTTASLSVSRTVPVGSGITVAVVPPRYSGGDNAIIRLRLSENANHTTIMLEQDSTEWVIQGNSSADSTGVEFTQQELEIPHLILLRIIRQATGNYTCWVSQSGGGWAHVFSQGSVSTPYDTVSFAHVGSSSSGTYMPAALWLWVKEGSGYEPW